MAEEENVFVHVQVPPATHDGVRRVCIDEKTSMRYLVPAILSLALEEPEFLRRAAERARADTPARRKRGPKSG